MTIGQYLNHFAMAKWLRCGDNYKTPNPQTQYLIYTAAAVLIRYDIFRVPAISSQYSRSSVANASSSNFLKS